MTPKEKAMDTLDECAFDTQKVLMAMAERFPQVFLELAEQHRRIAVKPPVGPVRLDEEQQATMVAPIRCGDIVPAIKYVRQITGAGLKEAKGYVDQFRGDITQVVGIPTLAPWQVLEVRRLIRADKYVTAIKYVRQQKNTGLKESKICIDKIRDRM